MKFKKEKPVTGKKEKPEFKSSNFQVSFQHFTSSQKCASSFKDWQNAGLLARALETLQGYCCRPLFEQLDGSKFTIYGSFPPAEKTRFIKPEGTPEDANWARIHVNNKSVIVGHIVGNTFYVVFLDKEHAFWLTKRVTEN